uniref:Alpha-1,2-mannosidase n=1 Tax=Mucochytrium quahogii TaxID=96639 RepID=A0A7S2SIE4_9STRA|mmetsp:Transcript_32257/g.51437  ORF Transcript_32257/g.51437 Transcript_32257/m.51437 type:complete len:816 (+) Transcript_32257:732-3179(+)
MLLYKEGVYREESHTKKVLRSLVSRVRRKSNILLICIVLLVGFGFVARFELTQSNVGFDANVYPTSRKKRRPGGLRSKPLEELIEPVLPKPLEELIEPVLPSVDYVDLLRGVAPGNDRWSYGNVLPIHSLPRGMTHWSVTTTKGLEKTFYVDVGAIDFVGVRATFEPSPWMGDYGQFLVMPSMQDLGNPKVWLQSDSKSVLKPHHLNLTIMSYCSEAGCTQFEFSPAAHGGMFSMRAPPGLGDHRRELTFKVPRIHSPGKLSVVSDEISGYSAEVHNMKRGISSFHNYISALVEWPEGVNGKIQCSQLLCSISWLGLAEGETVRVRVGNSFISLDQARLNRKRELDVHPTIESIVQAGRKTWNSYLDRVQVHGRTVDNIGAKQKLFTSLYRALLWPRDLAELDDENKPVHWSPYNGKVAKGHVMTDSGFWDAYRTLYPMLQLVYPDVAKDILSGWVNAIQENGGSIPEWPNPGIANMMEGTMSDCPLSDAIVTGLLQGEEADIAYEELLSHVFKSGRGSAYLKDGYVPSSVSLSQNFYLADWAIAQAAKARGDKKTSKLLLARSHNWTKLFNPETAFFQPKRDGGQFGPTQTFDEFEFYLRGPYTEGGPWQYRFYVPHDPAGLREAFAKTDEDMCKVLHKALTMTPAYHSHDPMPDASSMGMFNFGQYCHANQPTHHILYMFAHANGCALEGQKWIQKAIQTFYGKFGYAGDEDNGEQSSWLVLSALGLYQLAPGNGKYQVGAPPLFPKMVIQRPRKYGGDLTIERDAALEGAGGVFQATKVSFKDKKLDLTNYQSPPSFNYKDLLAGGTILFSN